MENLLLDQKFWLTSLEEDIAIEVSIQEDTLNLMYKGILMQEGMKEFSLAELLCTLTAPPAGSDVQMTLYKPLVVFVDPL